MNRLIAFVGLQSSGKNTAAQALYPHGYLPISFADALKDALATMFCWPRDMLEGITPESRDWREQVDTWWAERLGIPEFSPRWAMRHIGTDVMRRHFHEQIWVFNVERRLTQINAPVVLIDARYPNEIALAHRYGGHVERIRRGPDPWWFKTAQQAFAEPFGLRRQSMLRSLEMITHESEWAWLASEVDGMTLNDGSVADLHAKIVKKFCPLPATC